MQEAAGFRDNLMLEEHVDKVKHQSQHIENTEGYLAKSLLPA